MQNCALEISSLTSFPSLISPLADASIPRQAAPSQAAWSPAPVQNTGHAIIAQYFDQDFFGSSSKILTHFIESGQVWALLIGFVLGYLLRGLTSY